MTSENGETYVLQVEFQVADEADMVYRMVEYYVMLLRAYRLPVHQYVIYLGDGVPRMADRLESGVMYFKYRLLNLSSIDYQILLRAANPQEKMLGVLGDFGERDRVKVLAAVVQEVFTASNGDFEKERHLRQLLILANLRNLQAEVNIVMESVAKWFKIEKDPLYWRGQKEGLEKGLQKGERKKGLEVVKALLLNTDHSVAEIARLVNVTEGYVRSVKRSLKS